MHKNKKCLVGVVSWCDSLRFPERFKVFRRCVASLEKYISRDECVTAVIDNNSSDDVKAFIESSSFFDHKVMLPENIHDVGAYGLLGKIAQDMNLEYLWVLENDYVLFRKISFDPLISFLKIHPEVGYLRLQKFEYAHQERYDKQHKHTADVDYENTVWLKNIETKKPLLWLGPEKIKDEAFYINNWHFGMHGGFIPLETWRSIYPQGALMPYYYKFENAMRVAFNQLDKKVGVVDKGFFAMVSPSVYQPSQKESPLKKLQKLIDDKPGGYIEQSILDHYFKNYSNYYPSQIQLFGNSLGTDELKSLKEVFDSHWLGYGPKSKKFEYEFAKMLDVKYALGITSCTSGLFMSMEILGIGPGDEVIIPTVGFIGCANAVLKAGATVVFADVDPHYFNILPSEVARLITKKTKAIMLLHYAGMPAPIKQIRKILKTQKQKIYLVEDSANSFKSDYFGSYCGTLGDIGLFSLDANKTITTGTGGVLVTNDDDIYYKAQVARFYGLKPNQASGYDALKARKERWWEIDLEYHGNRYLINDITSSIALAQLPKLDRFIGARKKIWKWYNRELAHISILKTPKSPLKHTTSSYYFYWVQTRNADEQLSLAKALVKNGIYTSFRYYPLHQVEYYKSTVRLPNAEYIGSTALNLPLHQNLTQLELQRIVKTIKNWAKGQTDTSKMRLDTPSK